MKSNKIIAKKPKNIENHRGNLGNYKKVIGIYMVVSQLFSKREFSRVGTLIKLGFSSNLPLNTNLMRVPNWATHQMRKYRIVGEFLVCLGVYVVVYCLLAAN